MIMHRSDQALAIHALKSAAPYIRMYKGKTFVVKAGGGVFGEAQATRLLIEQIALLHHFGVRVVLVHGGGPQLTELGATLGVPARMVDGRRITDEKSIELIAMVLNGLINTRVLGICRALNIEAVGVSGVDAGLVRAHRRPPVRGSAGGELIDFGFVGDIDAVDGTVLRKLLDNGLMPVVSPLSADESGTLLNINADTVAAAIGASLQAEKLILCTGAPGILASVDDPRSLVSYTDLAGLKRLRDDIPRRLASLNLNHHHISLRVDREDVSQILEGLLLVDHQDVRYDRLRVRGKPLLHRLLQFLLDAFRREARSIRCQDSGARCVL